MQPTSLTSENYRDGFLIDDQWMGGVSENPAHETSASTDRFVAYVVDVSEGVTLGAHGYPTLAEALHAINRIPRAWRFESARSCHTGCASGGCQKSCGSGH
ncbi:MAG: hypothetical protein AB7P04_06470 [Bacteriovoracia bacterium]